MKIKQTYLWKHKYKLLGLLLFAYILSTANFPELWQSLKSVSPGIYLMAFSLQFISIFLKSQRWKILIPPTEGNEISALKAYRYYWIAIFWGAVTPGKIGELFKISYLRQQGYSYGSATAATVIDRLLDLLVLVVLVYLGMVFYTTGFAEAVNYFSLILLAGILGLFLLFYFRKKIFVVFLKFAENLLKGPGADRIGLETDRFVDTIKNYKASQWIITLLITMAGWALFIIERYLVALSLGLEVDFMYFSVTMLVMGLVTLLPVSILGLGTREAVLIVMLGQVGISSSQAIAFSALILVLMLFNTLVGYVLATVRKS